MNPDLNKTGPKLRASGHVALVTAIAGLTSILCLFPFLVLALTEGSPGGVILMTALSLAAFYLTYRCQRSCVIPHHDYVEVVNPLKLYIVDWTDIDEFEIGVSREYWSHSQGVVRLMNGSTLPMFAVSTTWSGRREGAGAKVVAILNQELAKRR